MGKDKYGVTLTSSLIGSAFTSDKHDGTFVLDYDTYDGGAGVPFLVFHGSIIPMSGERKADDYIGILMSPMAFYTSSAESYHSSYFKSLQMTDQVLYLNITFERHAGRVARCVKN
jgi:hypothetical protein